MGMAVKFLREETIEAEAEVLLDEYMSARVPVNDPPVPVDDILEIHLGLSLDFDDLHQMLGIPKLGDIDILGATWVESKEVYIDESLDPDKYPDKEGRYRFTVGHEIGHWPLHRHYFIKDPAQATMMFPDLPSKPSVVCRKSERKEPIEWQADFFASCLLMPRAMVLKAWQKQFGNMEPYILDVKKLCLYELPGAENPEELIEREFSAIARLFAPLFSVSIQAMRIRLEKLGLLPKTQTLPILASKT